MQFLLRTKTANTFFCLYCILFCASLFSKGLHAANEPTDKIDLVYTWVDGTDPIWQYARTRYSRLYRPLIQINDSNSENRFRDHQELKYSLRSVHKYAPFINHIYIVTYGHVPKWLKPHPKLSIINHNDIFLNQDDLPTFNSQAIECHLHRIPGLSEKYLYLNDDMFFGSETTPDDFFTQKGLAKVFLSKKTSPAGEVLPGEVAYRSSWKNTNALLDASFKKEKRYHIIHAPYALKKSLVKETEHWFPHVFDSVSSHKFRLQMDFTITNGLIQYYGMYTKKAVQGTFTSHTVWFGNDFRTNIAQLIDVMKNRYKSFCIEDNCLHNTENFNTLLDEFFESYFPEQAPWEKKEDVKSKKKPPCLPDLPGIWGSSEVE